ncbi:phosphatidate cytidylyltransferase [Bacillus fonticola]|uniref:phosphatidate cytidylyltransferase n=1 Tax=Bacillus fonticola TaxID=2728853 RepID=UPI001473C813|nr:phosphatidate cytidylyltransferase [Bacillus fonticola]
MKQRIITSILAGAVFVLFVMIGGLPLILFTYVLASRALYELLRMKKQSVWSVPGLISMALLWLFLLPETYESILEEIGYSKIELAYLGVLLFLTYTVVTKNRYVFNDVAFAILGTIYVGSGFYYLIETRLADDGLVFVAYALLVIWATDSGAYFIGRAIGKRKLWPEISPNKTLEGFIGGIGVAVVFSIMMQAFFPIMALWIQLILVTIVLSIFGQVGDLVESALKRHFGVKDSGTILPGHGGILDRFDSLLFVLPLLHFLQIV